MKKLLLFNLLLFIPTLTNAQGTGYGGPRLNRSNNFGVEIYSGYYNGYGYSPGLSYYGNSGFYTYNYPGTRNWFHQGYTPPMRWGQPFYGGNYNAYNRSTFNPYFYRGY